MSGLIYAVIVAVWLAVLIPIWLRRHDDAAQSRSADRYTRAMRTLSRRPAQVGSREIVLPPRPQVALAVASPGPAGSSAGHPLSAPVAGGSPRAVPRPGDVRQVPVSARRRPDRRTRAASAGLARRRARTLALLLGLTAVVLVLGVLGIVPPWTATVPALLVVAFVVHLRLQARRGTRRHVTARRPAGRTVPAAPAQPDARSRAVVVESKNEGTLGGASAATGHPTAAGPAVPVAVGEGGLPSGAPAEGDPDEEAWRPQSWPLPTYVTKPKAVRPVRVIDLTTPGAWTSGRLLDDEAEPVEQVMAAAEETTLELDAIVDRAAND